MGQLPDHQTAELTLEKAKEVLTRCGTYVLYVLCCVCVCMTEREIVSLYQS